MLCRIWSSYSGGNEKCHLLGYNAVWFVEYQPTSQRNISPPSSACHLLSRWFLAQLIFWTLKMEAICSFETSIDTQRTTRRYILEYGTLHYHLCENLKSYIPSISLELTAKAACSVHHIKRLAIPEWRSSWRNVRFGVLTAVLWDMRPCNLVETYRCFGGTWCLHLNHLKMERRHSPLTLLWNCTRLHGITLQMTIFLQRKLNFVKLRKD
jgi:hypothetical protein